MTNYKKAAMESQIQVKHITKKGETKKKWVFSGWSEMPDLTAESTNIKSWKIKGKWLIVEEGSEKYGYYTVRYNTEAPVFIEEDEVKESVEETLYEESFSGFSLYSDSPVQVVGEQKITKPDGEVKELYIYMLPMDKIGTYISLKANIIITE